MATILDEILAHKRSEVAAAKARRPLRELAEAVASAPLVRDFRSALAGPGVRVIAEIKRRAPSMQGMALDLDVAKVAVDYERGGAAAISVLTDHKYFGGSVEDLTAVRKVTGLPLLRKEFIVDPWQVHESRVYGADAILLIVRALSRGELAGLLSLTRRLGMRALVECHTAEELAAVPAEAQIVGINNRDLSTLRTDLAVTERLAPLVPAGKVLVSESGIKSAEDVRRLARTRRVNAVLVGAAVVGAESMKDKISELVRAVQM
jgi:indole-3-glycerol phosphate synthase